jgi:hypothetical protein
MGEDSSRGEGGSIYTWGSLHLDAGQGPSSSFKAILDKSDVGQKVFNKNKFLIGNYFEKPFLGQS